MVVTTGAGLLATVAVPVPDDKQISFFRQVFRPVPVTVGGDRIGNAGGTLGWKKPASAYPGPGTSTVVKWEIPDDAAGITVGVVTLLVAGGSSHRVD